MEKEYGKEQLISVYMSEIGLKIELKVMALTLGRMVSTNIFTNNSNR